MSHNFLESTKLLLTVAIFSKQYTLLTLKYVSVFTIWNIFIFQEKRWQ